MFTKYLPDLPWKLLSIESVLVVFSVLLALALNSWREARSQKHLANQALQKVITEVQTNCSRIKDVHSYHQAVASGERKPGGIQIGFLRNDAWDVAKTTGAAPYLHHEVLAKIGEVSAYQSDHRTIVKAYIQALFTIGLQLEQGEKMHPKGEQGVIHELVRIQEELLEGYQHLIMLLEEHYRGTIEISGVCKEV